MNDDYPEWLTSFMEHKGISLWGVADLKGFSTPSDDKEQNFDFAISWATPMHPDIMESIKSGPNQKYADEYSRANALINELANALVAEIRSRGRNALMIAASVRTDTKGIKGQFPHKTAATRAGLGWIGKHCQLITREFGPWVRLGTVFTEMILPCGTPIEKEFCGRCTKCIDACPADALQGSAWSPGIPREEIIDVFACDRWKKENYMQFHKGHNCGICSSVCPYGLKVLKKSTKRTG